jgi:hypothetical protein
VRPGRLLELFGKRIKYKNGRSTRARVRVCLKSSPSRRERYSYINTWFKRLHYLMDTISPCVLATAYTQPVAREDRELNSVRERRIAKGSQPLAPDEDSARETEP